jgi:hypothetical protein
MPPRPPMIFHPGEIPEARPGKKRGRPKGSKGIKNPKKPEKMRDLIAFADIKAGDLKMRQIGPRIPVLHVEYIKSVFDKTEVGFLGYGGIQPVITAFIEIIKRHPELEKEVLDWINEK